MEEICLVHVNVYLVCETYVEEDDNHLVEESRIF